MHKIPPIVLGVSLGTRRIGLAVLQHTELLHEGVKGFPGPWTFQKQHLIISTLKKIIREYRVQKVVLVRSLPSRSSPALRSLERATERYAQKMGIKFQSIDMQEIKRKCLKRNDNSISEIAEYLTDRFPELSNHNQKDGQPISRYHRKIFEAVAAALSGSR